MTSELSILFFIIVVCLVARIVHPGKNQQGHGLNGDARPFVESNILKVATFNVQTGKSLEGQRDIRRAAQVLSETDIVGVQEVYGAGWLNKLGFGKTQTASLAQPGNFAHLFAATRYRWFREQRGNLLLSKLPIQDWRIEMLPDQSRKSPRNFTVASFGWRNTQVVFINTHLHTGRGREQQLQAVLKEFAKHEHCILVGDFNSPRDTPLLREAIANADIIDAIEEAILEPQKGQGQRIDWILTKGFKVIEGKMIAKGISDHPFYQVSLSIEDETNI